MDFRETLKVSTVALRHLVKCPWKGRSLRR